MVIEHGRITLSVLLLPMCSRGRASQICFPSEMMRAPVGFIRAMLPPQSGSGCHTVLPCQPINLVLTIDQDLLIYYISPYAIQAPCFHHGPSMIKHQSRIQYRFNDQYVQLATHGCSLCFANFASIESHSCLPFSDSSCEPLSGRFSTKVFGNDQR
jgi:hypothetical protein